MKRTTLYFNIAAIFVLLAVGLVVTLKRTDEPKGNANVPPAQQPPSQPPLSSGPVRVTSPKPGESVVSPLTVTGEARGAWFFEASFPVRLVDASGAVIAEGHAEAQGDWMTEEYVPFRATLTFSRKAITAEGKLILEKDNPSGLPQNNASFEVPVTIAAAHVQASAKTATVQVHFLNIKKDPQVLNCDRTYPATRTIPATSAVARAAVEELLKGPTAQETQAGFMTTLNTGAKIQKLSIVNGTAYIDFNSQFNFQVGGSCRITAIRAQVENTLKQFATVKNVVLSVNGQTELILEP